VDTHGYKKSTAGEWHNSGLLRKQFHGRTMKDQKTQITADLHDMNGTMQSVSDDLIANA